MGGLAGVIQKRAAIPPDISPQQIHTQKPPEIIPETVGHKLCRNDAFHPAEHHKQPSQPNLHLRLQPGERAQGRQALGTFLESFCIVAVNVYVLVSGYFLAEAGFRLKRVFLLAGQVLFYSLAIPAVMLGVGGLAGDGGMLFSHEKDTPMPLPRKSKAHTLHSITMLSLPYPEKGSHTA